MNNTEKATEISKQYFGEPNQVMTWQASMKMAQWKDEQFSKFLLWLDDHYIIKRFTDGEPMTYGELIDAFKNMEK